MQYQNRLGRVRARRFSPVARLAFIAVAAGALLTAGCAVSNLRTAAELARRSEPFQATPTNPSHRLLIVGDSTAVGTGASSPGASVAGLIARDHTDWAITNRAADGAKFADVPGQLAEAGRYDTVLILCGGNDVIRLTGMDKLRAEVSDAAERARVLAPRVILMPSGNVGNAPFFYAPASWWMTRRSQALHAIVREVAGATGSTYVNLYKDRADDPFAQDPERLHSADKLHPSDAGYALWYQTLTKQAAL